MPSFQVIDSDPTARTKQPYFSAGRGGAGNFSRYRSEAIPQGLSAPPPTSAQMAFAVGRGGAGNMRTVASSQARQSMDSAHTHGSNDAHCAIFSFDEELKREQQMRDNAARVYSIGIGGAGNVVSPTSGGNGQFYTHSGRRTDRPRAARGSASSDGGSTSSLSASGSALEKESRMRAMMDKITRAVSRN